VPRLDVTQVEGFDKLNQKLKRLRDSVTRREVLKLMRRLSRPLVLAYRQVLPKQSGTLSRSVAVRTVPGRRSGGNPAIAIAPGRSGRNNGYYRFMVIPKGTTLSGGGRGSRKGVNTVVPRARDTALRTVAPSVVEKAQTSAADLVQKQIDRLSN